MRKISSFLIILLVVTNICIARSDVGAVWLLIPNSTILNGLGEIGVCLPERDISAVYFNPANGVYSYSGISSSYSSMETKWLPNLASDIYHKYSYLGFNIVPAKYPFQLVITKQKQILDLGEQYYMDESGYELGQFTSTMSAELYSITGRYNDRLLKIPVDVSAGITRKNVIQDLVPDEYLDSGSGTSENIFYDFGILGSLPFKYKNDNKWNFSLIPSFGYSKSNIGESIYFISPENADPGPRLARTGLAISANISLENGWKLFSFRGGRAASDILVEPRYSSEEKIKYQSGFGDIQFYKNILQSKGDSLVEVSRGQEISFLDIYSFRYGRRIDIDGKIDLYEYGYGINSNGILNFLYYITRIKFIAVLNRHINIRYDYSKWTEEAGHPADDTEFSSYTFSINNLDNMLKWFIDRYGIDQGSFNKTNLTILGGINISKIKFSNNNIQKDAKVKYNQGCDFGIETKYKFITTGLAYTQYAVNYQLDLNFDYFHFTPELDEIYHYLTLYSFVPYSIIKPIEVFGGIQVGNCICRNIEVKSSTECYNDSKYSLNYGLICGINIYANEWLGCRISYNYWARKIGNYFNDESFIINGFKVDLLIKL